MVKVDFKKIPIRDIEGHEIMADFRKQIGNQLYMQGKNIEECELGKRIYFAAEPVSLSDTDIQAVISIINNYGYVARTSIEKCLKTE